MSDQLMSFFLSGYRNEPCEPLTLDMLTRALDQIKNTLRVGQGQRLSIEPKRIIVPPALIISYARHGIAFFEWDKAQTMRSAKLYANDPHLKLVPLARTQKQTRRKAARIRKRKAQRYRFALSTGRQ